MAKEFWAICILCCNPEALTTLITLYYTVKKIRFTIMTVLLRDIITKSFRLYEKHLFPC